jgi:diguanylate cyclase (GGDEF)-like protein/PAS domain S-box-containing protein
MNQCNLSSLNEPLQATPVESLSGALRKSGADNPDPASNILARRTLYITLAICFIGAASGIFAIRAGMVAHLEIALIVCSGIFSSSTLIALRFFPRVSLQTIATIATSGFALNVCAGVFVSMYGKEHLNVFVYLYWTFPLLVFNRIVNQPARARLLSKILFIVPLLTIVCLSPKWLLVLTPQQRVLLSIYGLTYACYALTLNMVTRYREKYIVEQERMESLKIEAGILESISDCFISLDSNSRLVYLNDAACSEFAVERQAALNQTLPQAAPGFLSKSIQAKLREASTQTVATFFEAQSEDGRFWYDLRCFPRPDGMSIYFQDITSRKTSEARVQYLAFYDVLTQLPNRQFLRDRLTKALAAAAARGAMGALLYIDLDDFKTINDTMGHDVGDELVKQVALRLSSCIQPGDLVARIGGDEFVVMLEELPKHPNTSMAMAKVMGEKILGAFRRPFVMGTFESETTASIGITLFTGASDTVDDLLKRTDLAMYCAKEQGRNAMCFFDPDMQTAVEVRAALRSDLRRALQNDEFELHYQPQLEGDGIVTGAEALLRWFHPLRGRVAPDVFIPLAEEAGLIVEMGRWVLETACLQLAQWANNLETETLTLSVNVSIRQLLDPHFVGMVRNALKISGANPHRLKLEITESSAMEKIEEMIAKMRELKVYGIGFSLDDFGTGYSSLSYLRRLPLDQLKIDRSFVNNILTDPKDASIARTIILLGRSLNLSIIAEGVETAAQRDFLEAEGCHLYQGFLYSPAVTTSQFEAFVATSHLTKMHTTLADRRSYR